MPPDAASQEATARGAIGLKGAPAA